MLIESPFAVLEGEVLEDGLLFASGGVSYDGSDGDIHIEGVLEGRTALHGVAFGSGEGCELSADLYGYAIGEGNEEEIE